MNKKSIEEWLLSTDENFAEMAIMDAKRQNVPMGRKVSSLAEAIYAIWWENTGEEAWYHEEWVAATELLSNGENFSEEALARKAGGESPVSPPVASKPTPTPNTMANYQDQPVARPTLVFGRDVADLTESQCIDLLRNNRVAAQALNDLGVASTRIDQQIAGYAAANTALIARLDTFTVPAATQAANLSA